MSFSYRSIWSGSSWRVESAVCLRCKSRQIIFEEHRLCAAMVHMLRSSVCCWFQMLMLNSWRGERCQSVSASLLATRPDLQLVHTTLVAGARADDKVLTKHSMPDATLFRASYVLALSGRAN